MKNHPKLKWKLIRDVILCTFAVVWLAKNALFPATIAVFYSQDYMEQTYACDSAMENSWYFSQEDSFDQRSEKVELLACHRYDKTRKLMLMSGLPEAYLSWLGLRSLELKQRPAEEFVEQHRFTER